MGRPMVNFERTLRPGRSIALEYMAPTLFSADREMHACLRERHVYT